MAWNSVSIGHHANLKTHVVSTCINQVLTACMTIEIGQGWHSAEILKTHKILWRMCFRAVYCNIQISHCTGSVVSGDMKWYFKTRMFHLISSHPAFQIVTAKQSPFSGFNQANIYTLFVHGGQIYDYIICLIQDNNVYR